jgi:hypothetical protein
MDNLGLDVQHTVAFLGAHALGGASGSGFAGKWTINPDMFTTQFFQGLLTWAFDATPMPRPGPPGQPPQQQWNIDQSTSSAPAVTAGIFMLNTDMALIRDIDHNRDLKLPVESQPKHCDVVMSDDDFRKSLLPGATTPAPSLCPYLRFNNPALNFEYWVRWFGASTGVRRQPSQHLRAGSGRQSEVQRRCSVGGRRNVRRMASTEEQEAVRVRRRDLVAGRDDACHCGLHPNEERR